MDLWFPIRQMLLTRRDADCGCHVVPGRPPRVSPLNAEAGAVSVHLQRASTSGRWCDLGSLVSRAARAASTSSATSVFLCMLRDEVIRHDRRYSRRRRGSFAAVAVTLQCAVFRGFQNCRPYLSFATPRDTRVRWPHHDFGCRESVSLGVTRIRGKGVLDERVRTGYRRWFQMPFYLYWGHTSRPASPCFSPGMDANLAHFPNDGLF